ncbi:MAG: O-antigen ligase family protein [Deltaproteobacteria bacterium]|nr:O-antigen ligase family protein [Deltaproteobacteria bacterium]
MNESAFDSLIRRLQTHRNARDVVAVFSALIVCWAVGQSVARQNLTLPIALAGATIFVLVFFRRASLLFLAPAAMCAPNMGLDIPGPWAISIEDAFVMLGFAALVARGIVLGRPIIPRNLPAIRPMFAFWGIAMLSIVKTALISRSSLMLVAKDLMRLSLLMLFFVVMVDAIRTKAHLRTITRVLIALAVPMAAISWYIYLTKSEFFYTILTMKPAYIYYRGNILRMISIAGSTSFTGLYYAVILALALNHLPFFRNTTTRAWGYAIAGLLLSCLAMTFNRGTWVGVLFGYFLLSLVGQLNWRRVVVAAMLLGGLALITSAHFFQQLEVENKLNVLIEVSRSSGTTRLVRWMSSINVILDQPLLGVGYNNYAYVYGLYSIEEGITRLYGSPHNMYVDVVTGTGLVGFFVFSTWMYRLWRIHVENLRGTVDPEMKLLAVGLFLAFGIFLGASGFDSFFFKPHHTSFILMILWAMSVALWRINRDDAADATETERSS